MDLLLVTGILLAMAGTIHRFTPLPRETLAPLWGAFLLPALILGWGTLFQHPHGTPHGHAAWKEEALWVFLLAEIGFIGWLIRRASNYWPLAVFIGLGTLGITWVAAFAAGVGISGVSP